jgi:hypothetical protein
MTATIVTVSLALLLGQSAQNPGCAACAHAGHQHGSGHFRSGGFVEPPGPGDGWGFPNGNPDGYGWHNIGGYLPLGANRTTEYFFRRYFSVPPEQAFMPTYYNPYVMRGQRYLPFAGNGGCHPAGGPAPDTAITPARPYSSLSGDKPATRVPVLRGRVEGTSDTSGKTGLTP